jgi:xylulose-5-phosphate/fructose-6-phosphate phosphoketolase
MSEAAMLDLHVVDGWWRAANYVSVGQIYLLGNPLLREPLRLEHIKPRLVGHWGTTPGLNFIYAHLNRAIRAHDLNAIYITGPGHGGPGLIANTYLYPTELRALVLQISGFWSSPLKQISLDPSDPCLARE